MWLTETIWAWLHLFCNSQCAPTPSKAPAEWCLPAGPEIHHFDLYRLQGPQARMDLPQSFATAVSLVEWPERLPADAVPHPHLAVHLKRMDAVSSHTCLQHICVWPYHPVKQPDGIQELSCSEAHLLRVAVQAEQLQVASGQSSLQGLPESEALDEYEDRAWRLVTLHGSSQDWERRCQAITQLLAGEDEALAKPCVLRC